MYQQQGNYNPAEFDQQYNQNQAPGYANQNGNANSIMNQPIKTVIGTEECREIVQILNQKPFNLNYTLVLFDELTP